MTSQPPEEPAKERPAEPAGDEPAEPAGEQPVEETPAPQGRGSTRRPRSLLRVALLVALALVAFCALNEVAIRLVLNWKNNSSLQRWITDMPKLKPKQKAKFGLMVQPSGHSKLIYELRPKIEVTHQGVIVKTNSDGFRDREYPGGKGPNVVRIVGIGDSNMFGWGVAQDKNFLSVMERRLNKQYPRRIWEVINTGTPGYNTFMKVEALRTRALKYKPDVVLVQHTINDLLLPEFIYEYPDPWTGKRSYAFDFWFKEFNFKKEKFRMRFEGEFKEVPPGFEYMAGEEGFARAMIGLSTMREKFGFEVVMLVSHDHPVGIANAIERLSEPYGFHTLVRLHRTDDPTLIVSKKDLHPSVKGHRLIADAMLHFMRKKGVIQKLADRK